MNIKVELDNEFVIPQYQKHGDVGADLRSAETREVLILPGENELIKTGVKIELPDNIMATIHPRSGLASKNKVIAVTGIIDTGYRGEIKVNLMNVGSEAISIKPGDRIAQLVFNPVVRANFIQVDRLSDSERGEGGFGHTGL